MQPSSWFLTHIFLQILQLAWQRISHCISSIQTWFQGNARGLGWHREGPRWSPLRDINEGRWDVISGVCPKDEFQQNEGKSFGVAYPDIVFEDFLMIRFCLHVQMAGKVKCHKYSRRRPDEGWNIMVEKLGPQGKRGNGGGWKFMSIPDGSSRALNEMEKMYVRRETPRRRRRILPWCVIRRESSMLPSVFEDIFWFG